MAVTLQAILQTSFATYAGGAQAAAAGLESGPRGDAVPHGDVGRARAALSAGPRHGDLVQLVSPSRVSALLYAAHQPVARRLAATGAADRRTFTSSSPCPVSCTSCGSGTEQALTEVLVQQRAGDAADVAGRPQMAGRPRRGSWRRCIRGAARSRYIRTCTAWSAAAAWMPRGSGSAVRTGFLLPVAVVRSAVPGQGAGRD